MYFRVLYIFIVFKSVFRYFPVVSNPLSALSEVEALDGSGDAVALRDGRDAAAAGLRQPAGHAGLDHGTDGARSRRALALVLTIKQEQETR